MPNIITRFFRGKCPVFPEGQTVTVTYNNSEHRLVSTTCPGEHECTNSTCPIKATVATMYNSKSNGAVAKYF